MRSGITRLLLALGLAALPLGRALAQDAVTFEASEPHSAARVVLKADLYKPDGPGRFPAVILMHGCGGWQPAVRYGLQVHARHLRDRGFVVLNLDSFGPRHSGGGKLCSSDRDLYQALSYRTSDAFDGLRFLQRQDFVAPDNIFLMGQSNGGSVAIRAAKPAALSKYNGGSAAFRGVVAYYPWCGELGNARGSLSSPLLILAGGKDDWTPARECQGVKGSGAPLQVAVYPTAAHSFDLDILPQRFLGKLIGGDPQAAADSRDRMLAFFTANLTDEMKRERAIGSEQLIVAQTTSPTSDR